MKVDVLLAAPLLFGAGFFLWAACGQLMLDHWGAFLRLIALWAVCALGLYLVFRRDDDGCDHGFQLAPRAPGPDRR